MGGDAEDVHPAGRHLHHHQYVQRPHQEQLWIRNVTITTGLVDTRTTPTLLDMLVAGQVDTAHVVTHRFGLDQILEAYDVFARPAETGALKVVLTRR